MSASVTMERYSTSTSSQGHILEIIEGTYVKGSITIPGGLALNKLGR